MKIFRIGAPKASRFARRAQVTAGAVTVAMLAALIGGVSVAGALPKVRSMSSKVVATNGAPLSSIVVSGADVAFASNSTLNQIEVLDLKSGTLGIPIPVGPLPRGLDLSPDGSTLYVASSGANEVSVVDVASHRETHRITIPPGIVANDPPLSIAVANNGKALLTTGVGLGGARLLEIDLGTEAVRPRSDFNFASAAENTHLMPSSDRSHIGVVMAASSNGPVWMYDAATDSFASLRDLGDPVLNLALDRTGSRLLVDPGGHLFAGATLLGKIPAGGFGLVVAASATTAYRVQDTEVEVLDLARLRVVARIPLPENRGYGPGLVVLSSNGATLAVLTATGISIVAVADARPEPICTNAVTRISPTSGVLPICGAPLASVVIDGTGHAFASNPSRNEVDVVNVQTGVLETAIEVGGEPKGLDLSPDGATLYVADSGANQVSVVDVATRRETRRINFPRVGVEADTAFSVAVAGNGKVFLTTTFNGSGMGGRMLEITPSTGAVRVRTDFFVRGMTSYETYLVPSGDHSHIGVAAADMSSGPVWMYDAATDSFGPERDLGGFFDNIAMDRTGSRLLAGNAAYLSGGAFLLDGAALLGGSRGPGAAWSSPNQEQPRTGSTTVRGTVRVDGVSPRSRCSTWPVSVSWRPSPSPRTGAPGPAVSHSAPTAPRSQS